MADGPMDVDDFQSTSDKFLTWLTNAGATISPKIQLADLRDRAAGRGVVATENLAEDEELFTIPHSSILTIETSSLPPNISSQCSGPWLSFILAMLHEYLLDTASPFKPYFDILPTTFDTPMFWSEMELASLKGSAVLEKIGRESADALFQEKLIPTMAKHPDLFPAGGRSDAELLQLCHRMGSTVMAYAFDLDPPSAEPTTDNPGEEWEPDDGDDDDDDDDEEVSPKGMVPLADMLNADADRNNAKLFHEHDRVVMRTVKPVAAGEELLNDFGPLPRADLLRRYGYVTDTYAQYDVVEIPTALMRECAERMWGSGARGWEAKCEYAHQHALLDHAYDIARSGNELGQFPQQLCVFLNLLVLDPQEFERLAKKDSLPKAELTADAKRLLSMVLLKRRAEYPEEKEEGGVQGRKAMAKQVIDGEREVLREAIEALRDPTTTTNKKRGADAAETGANGKNVKR